MIKLHIFPINERFALCTKPPIIKQNKTDDKPNNNPDVVLNDIKNIDELISTDQNNLLTKGTDNKLFVAIASLQNLQIVTLTEATEDFKEINNER